MSDFKETCIWMSYRYAIGRKSIASVMHAQDIAKHLDWIPEDRRLFTSEDIIREVNDRVNWMKNVKLSAYGTEQNDAFTVLFRWFMENPQENPVDYFVEHDWYVDLCKGTVRVEDRKDIPSKTDYGVYVESNIFNDWGDFKDWVNLAKFIRGATHHVTVEFKGNTTIEDTIEWYDVSYWSNKVEIHKRYTKADEFPGWFLSDDYIKDIKPITK